MRDLELAYTFVGTGEPEVFMVDQLETQVKVDALLGLKSTRQVSRLKTQAGFTLICWSLEAELLLSCRNLIFNLVDEAYLLLIKSNLFYFMSTDLQMLIT